MMGCIVAWQIFKFKLVQRIPFKDFTKFLYLMKLGPNKFYMTFLCLTCFSERSGKEPRNMQALGQGFSSLFSVAIVFILRHEDDIYLSIYLFHISLHNCVLILQLYDTTQRATPSNSIKLLLPTQRQSLPCQIRKMPSKYTTFSQFYATVFQGW